MLTDLSIPQQSYLCYFNQLGFDAQGLCRGPRAQVQGGITAAMPGGSYVGAILSGFLTDRLGRKKSVMIGCCFWCVEPYAYGQALRGSYPCLNL